MATTGFPIITYEEALGRALNMPSGATAIVLGGVDAGKTTFVAEAVAAASRAGRSVGVLDCDLGQSEIGPPGTVGVGIANAGQLESINSLRDLPLLGTYFIGAVSPVHHALDVCIGAAQMARLAREQKPDIFLVDTCGWIDGAAACLFKRCLTDVIVPQLALNFMRADSPNAMLHAFGHLKVPEVVNVDASPSVQRKSQIARTTRRTARFLSALKDAQPITVSWDDATLLRTRLGTGDPLPHHGQRFLAECLRVPVLHAERASHGALYVVVNGERWHSVDLPLIERNFRTAFIKIVPAQKFSGLLVGLIDSSSAMLAIGLLSRIDFAARTITVRTTCRRPAAVAQIWFGAVRMHRDGKEKGCNRQSDI